MIIDFHTHTFPDAIADKAVSNLAKMGNVTPFNTGKLDDLVKEMDESHIDISVILPVATKPTQSESINEKSKNTDKIIYAGAIHPDNENFEEILDKIKAKGMNVIKLHPDYQGTYFNNPKIVRIIKAAAERDIITVTHAGIDVAYRNDVHCTPDMILEVLDELKGLIEDKLVLAHLGGYELQDEVLEKLIGLPVYMDTAAVLPLYPEKAEEIIKAHGPSKILFATDSPWGKQTEFIKLINQMNLTKEEKDLIFYKNALSLLKIDK